MNEHRTNLTKQLKQSIQFRDEAVQSWQNFVMKYCSFEDGIPSNPSALPPGENAQLTESITYWNKAVARDTLNLEKAMK